MAQSDSSATELDLLDSIINKLLSHNHSSGRKVLRDKQAEESLSFAELKEILRRSEELLLSEPTLLELDAPVKIVGEVHGQYDDLLNVFRHGGYPPTTKYLFLGKYLRWWGSVDVMCLLLAYKLRYPDSVYLLRGTSEIISINRTIGFYEECKMRYNVKLWKIFNTKCFHCLPLAAIVSKKIFCCQGGMSPEFDSMDKIREITRPVDCPDKGFLCDLLWSDPAEDTVGFRDGDRGVSYNYGPDVVAEFLQKHDISLIVRGKHPLNFDEGYTYFADGKLICLVSVPNLFGEYDNKAAMLTIQPDLTHSIQVLGSLESGHRTRKHSSQE